MRYFLVSVNVKYFLARKTIVCIVKEATESKMKQSLITAATRVDQIENAIDRLDNKDRHTRADTEALKRLQKQQYSLLEAVASDQRFRGLGRLSKAREFLQTIGGNDAVC